MRLKLIHKLLLAMFACTALVLVLITLVTRASIGRGFVDFLQQQERSQLLRQLRDSLLIGLGLGLFVAA